MRHIKFTVCAAALALVAVFATASLTSGGHYSTSYDSGASNSDTVGVQVASR